MNHSATWMNIMMEYQNRIQKFIMDESTLKYVEGSDEIVEHGAHAWQPLTDEKQKNQKELYTEYENFIKKIIQRNQDNHHIQEFEESSERVIRFLTYDGVVWEKDVLSVSEEIDKELKIQIFLLGQFKS